VLLAQAATGEGICIRAARHDLTGVIAASAGALALAALAAALFQPLLLWALLAGVALLGALALTFAFPVAAGVGWLVLAGSTPEMWLGDLAGGGWAVIVGVVKLIGLALAGVCVLRYGAAADVFNPGLAFLVMFAASLAHGRHANLDLAESLRSLIGSCAPFAFSFSRLSLPWAGAIIRVTRWLPLILVAAGAALWAAGLRPLFVEDGGWRLGATGHPAFLAGFALAALEACLLELLRDGRRGDLALLGVNALILVLTGARAPLFLGAGVGAIAILAIPSAAFGATRRVTLVLAGACLLPVLIAAAGSLGVVRLFNVLSSEAGDLSGRDLIWPYFQDAWDASPWVGWGVGAGKVLVPEETTIARLLGTTAAHNEYLRIGVDGGWVGLLLLIGLFVAWTFRHTRAMPRPDRWLMRLVLLAFAVHSYTDNTLIATTASVLFIWVSAVFARGSLEAGLPSRDPR
jgi:O-antigen ligase